MPACLSVSAKATSALPMCVPPSGSAGGREVGARVEEEFLGWPERPAVDPQVRGRPAGRGDRVKDDLDRAVACGLFHPAQTLDHGTATRSGGRRRADRRGRGRPTRGQPNGDARDRDPATHPNPLADPGDCPFATLRASPEFPWIVRVPAHEVKGWAVRPANPPEAQLVRAPTGRPGASSPCSRPGPPAPRSQRDTPPAARHRCKVQEDRRQMDPDPRSSVRLRTPRGCGRR